MTMGSVAAYAYEKLATDLATQIRGGTLRAGERIPSVRGMSVRHRVSVSTVLQAYRQLERMQLVEARPQSGFYVLPQRPSRHPFAPPPSPGAEPTPVGTAKLIEQIVDALADPVAVPLGAALPDASLLPLAALNRSLIAAVRRDPAGGATAVNPAGGSGLRREIAKREWNAGRAADREEILVTCGASEALNLALRVTTRPGDVVAVESPTFFGVLQAIEALGRRAMEIPTCPVEGMELEALEGATDAHPVRACVVTPNFQNPLGSLMPEAAKARLVGILGARGIPIIEDDTFGELFFEGAQPRSLRAWDESGMVLRCGSFGKTLAPGYRVGWLVAGRRFAEAARRHKLSATIATATPPQLAIADYLASGGYDRHLRRLRRTLRDNVARLAAEVAARFPAGTRLTQPRGGFVLWVELPAGADALALHERARAAGISICPGPIFSASGGFGNCLRLSAGHPWSDRTERAVARLAELLREG